MIHQSNNRGLFHLLSITVFSSLLFVGVAGVTDAQAEDLIGTAGGTEVCEDPNALDPGVTDKGKFRGVFTIFVDIGSFPDINASVTVPDFNVSGTGLAFSKNTKTGFFVWTGGNTGQSLAFSGRYKTDPDTGEVVLLKGKFVFQNTRSTCITTGKFRAITDPNPPLLPN